MTKVIKNTTSEQLAFEIFDSVRREDDDGAGTDITKSNREIGYRKGTILLQVTALSVLQRRVVNAAWFLAAQNPKQDSFDVDLSYFRWLSRYDTSHNYGHLRKVLNDCQQATVQVTVENATGDASWVSVQLLGRVAIAGGRISFKVDELIRRELENPKSSTFLSIRIGAALSQHGYTLYERLSAIAYQGTTNWISIDTLRSWTNTENSSSMAEYKQFKRCVIDKGINQINELTDLFITYEVQTGQGTRKVTHLRFKIRNNPKGKLVLDVTRPPELLGLYDTLHNEFALSPDEIQELVDNRDTYTDERINAAIEFTKARAATGQVKHPGRYLMTAIRKNYFMGTVEKSSKKSRDLTVTNQEVSPDVEAQNKLLTEQAHAQAEEGINSYFKLNEPSRARILAALARQTTYKSALKRLKMKVSDITSDTVLLDNKVLRHELGLYAYFALSLGNPK